MAAIDSWLRTPNEESIMRRRALWAMSLCAGLVVFGFSVAGQQQPRFVASPDQPVVPEKLKNFVPVTDEMLLHPKPENWIGFRNGYASWGYSPLKQIDASTVGQLR